MKTPPHKTNPTRHLPHDSEKGLSDLSDDVEPSFPQPVRPGNGLPAETVGQLAADRLEWLLHWSRHQMRARFSHIDFQLLHDAFHGQVFHPGQLCQLEELLADHYGQRAVQRKEGPLASLAPRLATLTPLERLTLADALEQAWRRQSENKSFWDVLIELGFRLF